MHTINQILGKNCGRGLFTLLFLILFFTSKGQEPGKFYYDGSDILELKGEWKFAADTFLTYPQVIEDTTAVDITIPGTFSSAVVDSVRYGPKGFGTYYCKILFEKNADLSDLAITVPEVALAYNLFIDDTLIGSLGKPGTTIDEEVPKIDAQIIELPSLEGEEAFLIFHVSNFRYSFGGIYYPPSFGNEKELRLTKERYNTIKLLILGTVIILAIYMLYVFLSLRKETFRVYFAVICLVLLFHTLSTGDMPLLDIFPNTNWVALKKISFISFFLIASSNGKFLLEIFPKYLNARIVNIYAIITAVAAIFTIVVPVDIASHLVVPFQITSVLFGLYFFESLIRASYARENGARMLLIGYAIAFLTGLSDILSTQYVIILPRIAHYGMFAYILHMTMVMAMRYVNALKRNESIAESLSLTNELLEKNVEDRTKKLQMQNDLIDAKNQELESALKEKDDLMAVVAHDLKAPFNQIHELSELLKDEAKLKKDHALYVEMIQKVTRNAKMVIENLVFIRSYQSDSFTPEMKAFDPVIFFDNKVSTHQSEANKKDIVIESAQSIKSKKLECDESALDRIVDNLLSNAIKFSPKNSKIAFEMLEEDKHLVIRVKDYGEGFSKEDKKNAFKKFQKLSARPTGGELSTGLGLSIIKTLVDKLGGEINLVSEKGKGAEFIIRLPKQIRAKLSVA